MKEILSEETIIEGQWQSNGKEIIVDDVCKRIEWLISEVLEEIGVDTSGWKTLYQDPKDNRKWVLYFPQSEIHGGGPPALMVVSDDEISGKYTR
ncbi:Imm27 family immunity protein [Sulfurovum mangrovi]|uniref:Imm27 family immunity protein n=1 Tax=Sulfurovum mangrovi TaxID=2893889 RepID=UPI001E4B67C7|nr:Imm27 family immunity protein [Sulfurovum mangrovi]UFH59579.1 immunity 27 family protein [Sulfurovum mangrovi]UFH60719.1 immunity 27 family protein [Sulfurovum mangrovi]